MKSVWLTSLVLLFLSSLTVFSDDRKDDRLFLLARMPSCRKGLSRIAKKTGIYAVAGLTVTIFPEVLMDLKGLVTGEAHLGYSIFFDPKGIYNQLNDKEKALWDDPTLTGSKLSEMLSKKLSVHLSPEDEWFSFFKPVKASQYFSKTPPPADLCRHKAAVLAAALRHKGFEAKVVFGAVQGDNPEPSEHAWVYLPKEDTIADPTIGMVAKRQEWERLNKPTDISWLFKVAPYFTGGIRR